MLCYVDGADGNLGTIHFRYYENHQEATPIYEFGQMQTKTEFTYGDNKSRQKAISLSRFCVPA